MKKIIRMIQKIRTKFYGIKKVGKKTIVSKPLQLDNTKGISLENGVFVADYAWLMGTNGRNEKGLIIEDNTVIGHFSHIIANKEVTIQRNVLIADKVFISDCTHDYINVKIPIINQGISFIKPVIIGEDSWIGENVSICGASIGKHCVIGANSVVTKDIPDYCVAVGSPAKIIKKYNFNTKSWDEME